MGISDWTARKTLLLIGSYIFYGAWNPAFVLLLLLSTIIDWYAAKWIEGAKLASHKKFFLLLSLVSNLGLLGFFKYGNFFLENISWLAHFAGHNTNWESMSIILPVGISFYTFQTLSYTIDIYRGNLKSCRSFLDFALYVTFFPQLVAGPIVRAVDFIPQCVEPKKVTLNQMSWGFYFMTLGLFQKVVLADIFLSGTSDHVFGWKEGSLNFVDAWIGAIGASFCLGFLLPDNFRFPYASIGFSDFWRRWHISLSTWLKDYLYIPLGGSRHGEARTMANLMITMVIGGFWHGASWNYIIWGACHGTFLIGEQYLKVLFKSYSPGILGKFLLGTTTFLLATMAQAIFRAPDIPHAINIMASLWGFHSHGINILTSIELFKVLLVMGSLIAVHIFMRKSQLEFFMEKAPSWFVVTIWSVMLFGIVIAQGGSHAFIYFQF